MPDANGSQTFIEKTKPGQPLLPASRSNVHFLRTELAGTPR
jgi:hypothetical protein